MSLFIKKICAAVISATTVFSVCTLPYIIQANSYVYAEETAEAESIVHAATGLHYTVENDEATITGCEDTLEYANIPAEIDGYPVKTIGEKAFSNNNKIKSVTIADGITSIKQYAFSHCNYLGTVKLPSTLTEIAEYAFRGADEFKTIDIPSGVTVIGSYAFQDCELQKLVIPEGVVEIGDYAFEGNNELTSVIFPSTLRTLGKHAFDYCYLKAVEIPYGVTTISEACFYGCTSLKQVILPESVLYIEKEAFDYCTSLTYINLPSSLISIGDNAFSDAKATEFDIPESVRSIGCYAFPDDAYETVNGVNYIGNWVVDSDYNATELNVREGTVGIAKLALGAIYDENVTVTLPSTLKYISPGAFYNSYHIDATPSITISESNPDICLYEGNIYSKDKTQLIAFIDSTKTSFDIPNGVYEIAEYAFAGNQTLTSVTFPDTLYYIGSNAFNGCVALTNPVFPEGLQYIGDFAFDYCRALTEGIIIPESVTEIGDTAFSSYAQTSTSNYTRVDDWIIHGRSSYSENFSSAEIGTEIRGIANNAYDTLNMTSVNIPGNVLYVGKSAFQNCNELVEVTFNEGTISIDDYAFAECEKLNTPSIPNSIIHVGAYAFKNCISAIEMVDGVGYVDKWVVQSDSAATTASVRSGTNGIAEMAFYGCTELTSISLPEELYLINAEAFEACLSLTDIKLPDSLLTIDTAAFAYCTSLKEITIPKNTVYMDYAAFAMCEALEKITITNPECIIYNSADTIAENAVIYGYAGSTAEEYANAFGRRFIPLGDVVTIRGDVNADGIFDIADIILLQKWLLGIDNVTLNNPDAADMYADSKINIFDLCTMKRELLNK